MNLLVRQPLTDEATSEDASPGRSPVVAPLLWALAPLYASAFLLAMVAGDYNQWIAVVLVPILFGLTIPLARREARRDRAIATMVLVALAAKFAGSLGRYFVAFVVYGAADAGHYHNTGAALAEQFRSGNWDLGPERLVGTHFIEVVTGLLYTATGASRLGGFLVFAWLAFLGSYCFYRAFRIAVPEGDHKRYALVVFFMPSILFWPSSIGKEAWAFLALGVFSLGAARILRRRGGGYVLAGLGSLGVFMVRPHVAVLLLAALFCGLLLRRLPSPATLVGVLVIAGAGLVVANQTVSFFKADDLSQASFIEVLENAEFRTTQGGSEFEAPDPQSVTGFAVAVVTVLFRPFPTEAHNAEALIASAEGLFLLVLLVASSRRIAAALGALVRRPYLAFVCAYGILFVLTFGSFGNFGLLARQRTQLLPLLLVLIAYPVGTRRLAAARGVKSEREADSIAVVEAPTTSATRRRPAGANLFYVVIALALGGLAYQFVLVGNPRIVVSETRATESPAPRSPLPSPGGLAGIPRPDALAPLGGALPEPQAAPTTTRPGVFSSPASTRPAAPAAPGATPVPTTAVPATQPPATSAPSTVPGTTVPPMAVTTVAPTSTTTTTTTPPTEPTTTMPRVTVPVTRPTPDRPTPSFTVP